MKLSSFIAKACFIVADALFLYFVIFLIRDLVVQNGINGMTIAISVFFILSLFVFIIGNFYLIRFVDALDRK